MDMEDIGGGSSASGERREMVTPQLRAALTKQGYKILGSHSGVKLCRWTKAQLRGRGGCYKHSFYGIESHRCMEATPSLACANKCVFCWRHHTNPVGREWRWKMDDAETLVRSAVSEHRGMIKQMRGVPGVIPERFEEGMDPRHCALSLVGEPIMYPEIGTFVGLLHERRISTFLVTNAQFPEAIENLPPITQLYVSVDAATPDTLKAIDDRSSEITGCVESSVAKRSAANLLSAPRASPEGPPFLPRNKKRAPLCQTATAPSMGSRLPRGADTDVARRSRPSVSVRDAGQTATTRERRVGDPDDPSAARLAPASFLSPNEKSLPPNRSLFSSSGAFRRVSLPSARSAQRTVYRLTLVAGWNAEDAAQYAKLIDLGKPDFIEIKGMTYCGMTSGARATSRCKTCRTTRTSNASARRCVARAKHNEASSGASAAGAEEGEEGVDRRDAAERRVRPRVRARALVLRPPREEGHVPGGRRVADVDRLRKVPGPRRDGRAVRGGGVHASTPSWSVWGAEEGGFDPGETRVRKAEPPPGRRRPPPRRPNTLRESTSTSREGRGNIEDSGRDGAGARGGWVQGLPSGAAPAADGQPGERHVRDVRKGRVQVRVLREEAVLACLRDRVGDADAAAGKETVLMVVGAGRGPPPPPRPSRRPRCGRKLRVYAVEKNPNAVITLQSLVEAEGVAERERDIGRHASRGSAGEGGRAGVGAARIVWG